MNSILPAVRISISEQMMYLEKRDALLWCAPVSTGKNGVGFSVGSGCTPTGRFAICSKHGTNAPLATVFQNRVPVGLWPAASCGGDDILSRILCLEGLEETNANTRSRYIYIHGTNEVELLGRPASHGCVRLSPREAAELYELVSIGTPVFILP